MYNLKRRIRLFLVAIPQKLCYTFHRFYEKTDSGFDSASVRGAEFPLRGSFFGDKSDNCQFLLT